MHRDVIHHYTRCVEVKYINMRDISAEYINVHDVSVGYIMMYGHFDMYPKISLNVTDFCNLKKCENKI